MSEQANQGRTIIDKLEKSSDVSSAIILLAYDDFGREKHETTKNHVHDRMLYLNPSILLVG